MVPTQPNFPNSERKLNKINAVSVKVSTTPLKFVASRRYLKSVRRNRWLVYTTVDLQLRSSMFSCLDSSKKVVGVRELRKVGLAIIARLSTTYARRAMQLSVSRSQARNGL